MRDKAARAAPDAAFAMGQTYQRYVRDLLAQRSHPAGTWTNSPRGAPPAEVSSELRRSVTCVRGPGGGTYGSARVGPHTVYARLQEKGGVIHAHRRVRGGWTGAYLGGRRGPGQHTLHFVVNGVDYFPMEVTIPKRPYMRPALEQTVASGALRNAAAASFLREVYG